MLKAFIFLFGFGLTVIGITYIIIYLNLIILSLMGIFGCIKYKY